MMACSRQFHYIEDNIVEEIIEEVIADKTGLDLDLTPASSESVDH